MIPLVIDVSRESQSGEQIRLVKMFGAHDVGMFTHSGLIQLDYQSLVEVVEIMVREEEKELKSRRKLFGKWLLPPNSDV